MNINDLRQIVTETLAHAGVLGRLRAELRATVFIAIDEAERDDGGGLAKRSRTKELRSLLESEEGVLLLQLVHELLAWARLGFTRKVLEPEVDLPEGFVEREELQEELGLPKESGSEPLLLTVLRQFLHGAPTAASTPAGAVTKKPGTPVVQAAAETKSRETSDAPLPVATPENQEKEAGAAGGNSHSSRGGAEAPSSELTSAPGGGTSAAAAGSVDRDDGEGVHTPRVSADAQAAEVVPGISPLSSAGPEQEQDLQETLAPPRRSDGYDEEFSISEEIEEESLEFSDEELQLPGTDLETEAATAATAAEGKQGSQAGLQDEQRSAEASEAADGPAELPASSRQLPTAPLKPLPLAAKLAPLGKADDGTAGLESPGPQGLAPLPALSGARRLASAPLRQRTPEDIKRELRQQGLLSASDDGLDHGEGSSSPTTAAHGEHEELREQQKQQQQQEEEEEEEEEDVDAAAGRGELPGREDSGSQGGGAPWTVREGAGQLSGSNEFEADEHLLGGGRLGQEEEGPEASSVRASSAGGRMSMDFHDSGLSVEDRSGFLEDMVAADLIEGLPDHSW